MVPTCNLAGSPGLGDWSIGGVWSAQCWRPEPGKWAPGSCPPWSPGGQMAIFSDEAQPLFCGYSSSLQDIIQNSNNWALSRKSKYIFWRNNNNICQVDLLSVMLLTLPLLNVAYFIHRIVYPESLRARLRGSHPPRARFMSEGRASDQCYQTRPDSSDTFNISDTYSEHTQEEKNQVCAN